jgi:hypothetical protein
MRKCTPRSKIPPVVGSGCQAWNSDETRMRQTANLHLKGAQGNNIRSYNISRNFHFRPSAEYAAPDRRTLPSSSGAYFIEIGVRRTFRPTPTWALGERRLQPRGVVHWSYLLTSPRYLLLNAAGWAGWPCFVSSLTDNRQDSQRMPSQSRKATTDSHDFRDVIFRYRPISRII